MTGLDSALRDLAYGMSRTMTMSRVFEMEVVCDGYYDYYEWSPGGILRSFQRSDMDASAKRTCDIYLHGSDRMPSRYDCMYLLQKTCDVAGKSGLEVALNQGTSRVVIGGAIGRGVGGRIEKKVRRMEPLHGTSGLR